MSFCISGGDRVTHLCSLEFCALFCSLLSAPLLSKSVLSLETATLCTRVLTRACRITDQAFSTHGLSHEGTTGRGPVNGHCMGVLKKGKEPLGAQWILALQAEWENKGGLFLHLSLQDTGERPSGSLEILSCAVFYFCFLCSRSWEGLPHLICQP